MYNLEKESIVMSTKIATKGEIYITACLTIPANCETSMKNAKTAAQIPVKTVLLTGT